MSEYAALKVTIEGLVPCILNNGRKANPMDKYAKLMREILSQKPRGGILTDEQAEKLAEYEFLGAMYVDAKNRPCWPAENIEAMLVAGAKKFKKGTDAKAALFVDTDAPIEYDGPKTPEGLWKDERFRKVCMAKNKGVPVLKCRPIFNEWRITFVVRFDPEIISRDAIESWIRVAGQLIGLSDWRPRHGRFQIVEITAA